MLRKELVQLLVNPRCHPLPLCQVPRASAGRTEVVEPNKNREHLPMCVGCRLEQLGGTSLQVLHLGWQIHGLGAREGGVEPVVARVRVRERVHQLGDLPAARGADQARREVPQDPREGRLVCPALADRRGEPPELQRQRVHGRERGADRVPQGHHAAHVGRVQLARAPRRGDGRRHGRAGKRHLRHVPPGSLAAEPGRRAGVARSSRPPRCQGRHVRPGRSPSSGARPRSPSLPTLSARVRAQHRAHQPHHRQTSKAHDGDAGKNGPHQPPAAGMHTACGREVRDRA
mmetsp:Transcript_72563/g.222218  ORF Transcript_72563/g.222218 Transcript_72563/m.222218 type:complete len:287 (+) Transcript_72563:765-1625(+)